MDQRAGHRDDSDTIPHPVGRPASAADVILEALVEQRCLGAATCLRRRIGAALSETEGLTVSQISQVLETSRKFALPICEYLDRAGVTQRHGDVRIARSRPT